MNPTRRSCIAVAAAAAAIGLLPPAGRAAPSDDGEDQALLSDADFAAAVSARQAGDFARALPRLQAALKRFPDSANVHNELGFAHRQLGTLELAFVHYKRALAIDPRHRGAHEYIGEAYLIAGDLAGAERHQAALREICLVPCDELKDLDAAIAAFRARSPARQPRGGAP